MLFASYSMEFQRVNAPRMFYCWNMKRGEFRWISWVGKTRNLKKKIGMDMKDFYIPAQKGKMGKPRRDIIA